MCSRDMDISFGFNVLDMFLLLISIIFVCVALIDIYECLRFGSNMQRKGSSNLSSLTLDVRDLTLVCVLIHSPHDQTEPVRAARL